MTQNTLLLAITAQNVINAELDIDDLRYSKALDDQLRSYTPTPRHVDVEKFDKFFKKFLYNRSTYMPYLLFGIRELNIEQFIEDTDLRRRAIVALKTIDTVTEYPRYRGLVRQAMQYVLGPWFFAAFDLLEELGIYEFWYIHGSATLAELTRCDPSLASYRFAPTNVNVMFAKTSPKIDATIKSRQKGQFIDENHVRHEFEHEGHRIILTYRDLEFCKPVLDGLDFIFNSWLNFDLKPRGLAAVRTRTFTTLKPVSMSFCEKYRARGFGLIVMPGTITGGTVTVVNLNLYASAYANCLVDEPKTHVEFVGMKVSKNMPFPCQKVTYTFRGCDVFDGTFPGQRFDSCVFRRAILPAGATLSNCHGNVSGHVVTISGCANLVYNKTMGSPESTMLDVYNSHHVNVVLTQPVDICLNMCHDVSVTRPPGPATERHAIRVSVSNGVNIGSSNARMLISGLEIVDSDRVSVCALDIDSRKIENSRAMAISVVRLHPIKMPPSPEDEKNYAMGLRYMMTIPDQKCARCNTQVGTYSFSCLHPLCQQCMSTLVHVNCPVCV